QLVTISGQPVSSIPPNLDASMQVTAVAVALLQAIRLKQLHATCDRPVTGSGVLCRAQIVVAVAGREKGRSDGPKVVTCSRSSGRIKHVIETMVAEEYAHPVARAVADMETMLAECAGAPLWSLQDKDVDELLPRAHALLGRVVGSLVLPLVREADR